MKKYSLLIIVAISLLVGCDTTDQNISTHDNQLEEAPLVTDPLKTNTPELRQWERIIEVGEIRALKLNWETTEALPRSVSTAQYHQQLFEQFAEQHNLSIRWVVTESLAEMFERLANHEADIIPRHLTRLESRAEDFQFSRSITQDRELLIGAAETADFALENPNDLILSERSSYLQTAAQYPHWQISFHGPELNQHDAMADHLVANPGQKTILDQSAVEALLSYRSDIRVLHEFPDATSQAWLINQQQPTLLLELNNFIQATALQRIFKLTRSDDLQTLKNDKLPLRMITRNSPETYFMWRGELMGFDYELIREFARRQGLKLQVVVAETYDEMIALLEQGKGDVIAAGLTRTEARQAKHQFTIRYNRVDELLVANRNTAPISGFEDLAGRELFLRKTSAFWDTGLMLQNEYGVKLHAVDESMSTEMLISQVAEQSIDLTIADSNLIAIEQTFRDEIIAPLVLNETIPWAYIVRQDNPQLLQALNAYIRKEYRQTYFNVVKQKYFSDRSRKERHREERVTQGSELSPYDELVKKHAKRHKFDWRLITSLMYQESKFDPNAKSGAGALGLMQVLPSTAEELGYEDLFTPEVAIAAGVDYLNWAKERFSDELPLEERIFFALAAYNVGFGHVYDAKRLARQKGWDHEQWFNNVERAMLLLAQPKYYKASRFGYARGTEPVNYVRSIHQRYLSYLEIRE